MDIITIIFGVIFGVILLVVSVINLFLIAKDGRIFTGYRDEITDRITLEQKSVIRNFTAVWRAMDDRQKAFNEILQKQVDMINFLEKHRIESNQEKGLMQDMIDHHSTQIDLMAKMKGLEFYFVSPKAAKEGYWNIREK